MTRLVIGEALASDALDRTAGALGILDAKARAVVVAEVELGKVAMQVSLADAVIDASDAALNDGEEVFTGIDADEASETSILVCAVVDGMVSGELLAELG